MSITRRGYRRSRSMSTMEKFIGRLPTYAERDETCGCMLWKKGDRGDGYVDLYISGVDSRRVHRISYELFVGPIPDGSQVDHMCGVTNCVEPYHLRLLTNSENSIYRDRPEHRVDSGFTGVFMDPETKMWSLAIDLREDSGAIEAFPSPESAHEALMERREKFARVGTVTENRAQLKKLWELMKSNPSMSRLPLYP